MNGAGERRRSRAALAAFGLLAATLAAGFTALGLWQIERRAWKLDLIERVEARSHGDPSAPPGPEVWGSISAENAEYLRVNLSGVFDHGAETLVQAVTDYGGGFWVLTPLKTDAGFRVLVNRGFVSPEMRDPATRPAGQMDGPRAVTGLLRLTEPKGAFLRENDSEADIWRSRDVAAIAERRGLARPVAPYFVDADATQNPGGWPIGGLTIVAFRNNHLVYALTWFALAVGSLVGGALVVRHELRGRRA